MRTTHSKSMYSYASLHILKRNFRYNTNYRMARKNSRSSYEKRNFFRRYLYFDASFVFVRNPVRAFGCERSHALVIPHQTPSRVGNQTQHSWKGYEAIIDAWAQRWGSNTSEFFEKQSAIIQLVLIILIKLTFNQILRSL